MCLSHSWGLFSDLTQLSNECLSVAVQHIRLLHLHLGSQPEFADLVRARAGGTNLNQGSRKTMGNVVEFAMFATLSTAESKPLPPTIRACFRVVEITRPSYNIIVYAHCLASGLFTNPKTVAEKAVRLFQVNPCALSN